MAFGVFRKFNIKELVLAGMFASITFVLAYVRIPLPLSQVPISGQTFGVMLSGGIGGGKVGFISQAVYLLLGLIGVPVFAGGNAGPGVLVGPTGGYLWSFPFAAYFIGRALEGKRRPSFFASLVACFLGGVVLVYAMGVFQLMLVMNLGISQALLVGAVPFILGDVVKAVAGALVICRFPSGARDVAENRDYPS
jgi:biotin transport system substrate-specific component